MLGLYKNFAKITVFSVVDFLSENRILLINTIPNHKISEIQPNLTISTSTSGLCLKWHAKEGLEIAHLGIFRRIGHRGGRVDRVKVNCSKYRGFWGPVIIFSEHLGKP